MVLAGFIIAQMVIAAEKVRGMSGAMAFRGEEITHVHDRHKKGGTAFWTPFNGSSPVAYSHFSFMLYNTDIKGERYGGDKEEVLGKGSDTHQ